MPDFLARMAIASARRVARRRRTESDAALRRRAMASPDPRPLRLGPAGFDLITEIKKRSPAAGVLEPSAGDPNSLVARARAYEAAGAAAISVLTEPEAFGGDISDLRKAAAAVSIPVIRKDFIVDPSQILEARAAGASGALLILRLLRDGPLEASMGAAVDAGLFVILEAFDAGDLARAGRIVRRLGSAGPRTLVGVNCRDLSTLRVRRERLGDLRDLVPDGVASLAESGMECEDDVRAAARMGYRAALVGSCLMRAPDPEALAALLIRAGSEEAGRCAFS